MNSKGLASQGVLHALSLSAQRSQDVQVSIRAWTCRKSLVEPQRLQLKDSQVEGNVKALVLVVNPRQMLVFEPLPFCGAEGRLGLQNAPGPVFNS